MINEIKLLFAENKYCLMDFWISEKDSRLILSVDFEPTKKGTFKFVKLSE
jgi:hypothetical protein